MESATQLRKIAFLGDYLPRQCGIATFTTDLHSAIKSQFSDLECPVIAVSDRPGDYTYPPEVRFEISEQELPAYRRAADFLNLTNADILCVQHEFGIYGGPHGSHLLALLQGARMPVVTTLHTILTNPNDEQRRVFDELVKLSARVVVMAEKGATFLREIYGVDDDKIDVIAHGIPDVPFVDPNFFKDKFGVEGRLVLLTFGLLSPNKGIETVLDALPRIVEQFPEVVYVILGATHPNLVRDQGETYRLSLERRVKKLGVERHVIFFNRFVEQRELTEFIGAADLYVTPYLNEAQITSGTLAFSFGAGKAIVSTPYWHAVELLADDRGSLVPFRDPDAMAVAICELLGNESRRHAMRRNAYRLGREMIWSRTAERYVETFGRARWQHRAERIDRLAAPTLDRQSGALPPWRFDHLLRMSDPTGLIQHATFAIPLHQEGYCVDDNARALILTTLLSEIGVDFPDRDRLTAAYAAFVQHAFDRTTGRFRNFMTYQRTWWDEIPSEDSHGRTLWALGTCVGRVEKGGLRRWAAELFENSLPVVESFTSPRAWAFTILGLHEYLRTLSGDMRANRIREELSDRLVQLFASVSGDDWPWFENTLSYDNAKLPHALILTGRWTGQPEVLETGLRALRWLAAAQTSETGTFRPIGSEGFWERGGEPAKFDQQPIEAHAMISASLEAYSVTRDPLWLAETRRAFDWFLGSNDLGAEVYDPQTGGCRDGLHIDRVNQNQGAESMLSFLLSLAEMRKHESALLTERRKASSPG